MRLLVIELDNIDVCHTPLTRGRLQNSYSGVSLETVRLIVTDSAKANPGKAYVILQALEAHAGVEKLVRTNVVEEVPFQ